MRKLAVSAGGFSGAILLSALLFKYSISFAAICAFFCVLSGIISFFIKNRKVSCIFRLIALSMSAGFLLFAAYSSKTTCAAKKVSGEEQYVSVVLSDFPVCSDTFSKAYGRIVSDGIPGLKTVIYDYSELSALKNAEPGQLISFEGKIKSADTRYGENYDYYNSLDIYFITTVKSDIVLGNITRPVSSVPARIKRAIENKIEVLYNGKIAVFMKSLMLGSKTDFYQDKSMDYSMSRAGIMHIVAVSGMHISFLIGLIRVIAGNTRRSSFICLLIIWFFILITGAGPSAVRAGVMQSIVISAPILKREDDPVTSLMTALAIILIFNPYAILSTSLQLSFSAMAGIILFSERIYSYLGSVLEFLSKFRLGRYILGIVSSSVAVMILSVPLTAIHFKSIPLLSILTNILVLWAVSICFCGGYLSCITACFIPALGKCIGSAVSFLVRYILQAADAVSSVSFSVLDIRGFFAAFWIFLTYAFFILAYFSELQKARKILAPSFLSFISLIILLSVTRTGNNAYTGVITALDVGQGQCICFFAGENTIVVDCGGINSVSDAGETAGSFLRSAGRSKIDCLILTHLHDDHTNGIESLLQYIDIDRVFLPEYQQDDASFQSITNLLRQYSVLYSTVDRDSFLYLGSFSIDFYPQEDISSENENCMVSVVSIGDYNTVITGDLPGAEEKNILDRMNLHNAELLIAGHHGSRYSSSNEFITSIGSHTAIISCGYNTYGHPAYETLSRLDSAGYKVFRTDLNGNVRIVLK